MAQKIVFAIVLIGVATVIVLFTQQKNPTTMLPAMLAQKSQEKTVDYKASFAIFTHGTFRVFTAAMYHNLSDEVFIQADNPNIVHVKKSGVTWNDFFTTLPFKLTKECLTTGTVETFCSGDNGTLKFYLNGKKTEDLLDKTIQAGDKALITFGNETEKQIQEQMKKVPD